MCAVRVCTRTAAAEKMMIFGRYKMYSNDAITHGKIKWRSLLICWLIILAGYLMIRMVFLVFGLQLHLTAQGVCLALLP